MYIKITSDVGFKNGHIDVFLEVQSVDENIGDALKLGVVAHNNEGVKSVDQSQRITERNENSLFNDTSETYRSRVTLQLLNKDCIWAQGVNSTIITLACPTYHARHRSAALIRHMDTHTASIHHRRAETLSAPFS